MSVRFGIPEPSTLKARVLMRARIVTCASPAYLARAGTPRRPVDIEKHACVRMRDWRTGAPFAWELVRGEEVVKVNASGQLIVNDGGAAFAACLGGHGLAQSSLTHANRWPTVGSFRCCRAGQTRPTRSTRTMLKELHRPRSARSSTSSSS